MAWRLITEKPSETVETVKHQTKELQNSIHLSGIINEGEVFHGLDEQNETVETVPALYFLAEIEALKDRTQEELTEIHTAKLAYPNQRIIQEGVE